MALDGLITKAQDNDMKDEVPCGNKDKLDVFLIWRTSNGQKTRQWQGQ